MVLIVLQKENPIMKNTILFLAILLFVMQGYSQEKTFKPGHFERVIISPHIEVVFVEGDEETVELMSITESMDKFNVDLKNKKLHLYLDDAKIADSRDYNWDSTDGPYKGTVAKVVVTYKKIISADLRGEEAIEFSSQINQDNFKLSIYGETNISMSEVNLNELKVNIYGESELLILEGTVKDQKITAYGESEVDASNVISSTTKITSYGEGLYELNVSDDLKIVSFGESEIIYSGDPNLNKKLILGESTIRHKS